MAELLSKKTEKKFDRLNISTLALDNAIYGIIAAIFFLSPIFFTGLVAQGVGFEKMSIEDFDEMREQATDANWGNIATVAGTAAICANVIRPFPFSNRTPDNFPLTVITSALNQAKVFQSGIDVETSYRMPLSNVVDSWEGSDS